MQPKHADRHVCAAVAPCMSSSHEACHLGGVVASCLCPGHAASHVEHEVPPRHACVRSHAKRHTGCHQPEADWLLSSINSPRPQLISSHPDLSVEVLLDTPPESPKNCPEARGGSIRVQISLSRPVSFFMVKPRLCRRKDQSSPLQSCRQLGSRYLEVGSWLEAGTILMVRLIGEPLALDCLGWDSEGSLWVGSKGRVSGGTGRGRGVNFVTLAGSSLTHHIALPDHGVGLDGQSCSCLIVGRWVDLFLGRFGGVTEVVSEHGFVHASGTHDLIGCLVSIARTIRDENLTVEGVQGQTQTRSERRETNSENWAVVWTGQKGGNKTSLGKDFIKSWKDEDRENVWSNEERAWTSSYHGTSECYCRATVRDDPTIIQLKPIVEALRRVLKEQLWTA
ncbi:hypothetical protein YC2023_010900 [Brassica napus]